MEAKFDLMVAKTYAEKQGKDTVYWVELKRGYCFGKNGPHHQSERNETDIFDALEEVEICDCSECR